LDGVSQLPSGSTRNQARISPSILMYGRDSQLLKIRKWVLESCGYQVRTESDLREIPTTLAAKSFDLLILCHSATAEDCEIVLQLANLRCREIKTLILRAGVQSCHAELPSNVFDITDGPAKLLSAVNNITQSEPTIAVHACSQ